MSQVARKLITSTDLQSLSLNGTQRATHTKQIDLSVTCKQLIYVVLLINTL